MDIYIQITEDLASYDEGSQGPYKHIWHHNDERWDETHFFTAPTGGMDTLQTFEVGSRAWMPLNVCFLHVFVFL